MPRYQSHKIVHALKIKSIVYDIDVCGANETDGSATITPEDAGFAPFKVPRHKMFAGTDRPGPGWYYVVYPDGYASYSPEKAFEEGYTIL